MDEPDVTIDLHQHEYLPNGALLLLESASKEAGGMNRATVVLAKTEHDFVTWLRVYPDDQPSFCTSGDYFGNDLRAALDSYEKRQG